MSRPAFGTSPIKCAKRGCGWTGKETDLLQVPHKAMSNAQQYVCPTCGHDSYTFPRRKRSATHSVYSTTQPLEPA